MDIKQIVNSKAKGVLPASTTEATSDFQTLQTISQINNPPIPEAASECNNSPHEAEQSRYSGSRHGSQLNGINGTSTGMRYPSPTAIQNPVSLLPQTHSADGFDKPSESQNSNIIVDVPRPGNTTVKAFPCCSCGKRFARRSDLARHERIHSGVRPHVCEHPNCGKQFIQRSALTVHMRVHTGEKPHMCERCGKPFSDSSSLARHRRIHSGKRPYKCPYADCQKTFTRRTTLTRHQNHHTGTVEEAAAATTAALATRGGSNSRVKRVKSEGESFSNNASPLSTPSPGQRTLSASPNSELAPINGNMHRQSADFHFVNNSSLPGRLRGEFNMSNQPPTVSTAFSNGTESRPTSHPTNYDPPSILEPPTNNLSERPLGGSQNSSPHRSGMNWQSPAPNMLFPATSNNYVYPDPDPYGSNNTGQQTYYPNSNIRRPGSTGSESYEIKPRISDMWTAAQ